VLFVVCCRAAMDDIGLAAGFCLQRGLWGLQGDFSEGCCCGEVLSHAVGCIGDGCCLVFVAQRESWRRARI